MTEDPENAQELSKKRLENINNRRAERLKTDLLQLHGIKVSYI